MKGVAYFLSLNLPSGHLHTGFCSYLLTKDLCYKPSISYRRCHNSKKRIKSGHGPCTISKIMGIAGAFGKEFTKEIAVG